MDIKTNWHKIRQHFYKSSISSLHVSIASVDLEHYPTVTPIGSFFLNHDQTGFYFEKYATKLPLHSTQNRNICVLSVNSSFWFWLKSLIRGKFQDYPAMKLYGVLGKRRKATEQEMNRFRKRTRFTKSLRGHQYLWSDNMIHIREITFLSAEKINLGKMTQDL